MILIKRKCWKLLKKILLRPVAINLSLQFSDTMEDVPKILEDTSNKVNAVVKKTERAMEASLQKTERGMGASLQKTEIEKVLRLEELVREKLQ